MSNYQDDIVQRATPPPGMSATPQPFNMQDMLRAFSSLIQQQGQNKLGLVKEAGMAPQTRHLGMGGEDITGKTGPYDSGGIDWLHAHNSGAGLQSMPMGARPAPLPATPMLPLPSIQPPTGPVNPAPTSMDDPAYKAMMARKGGFQTPQRF